MFHFLVFRSVYDVDSLRHVWRVGPSPGLVNGGHSASSSSPSPGHHHSTSAKLAYLSSLGDTAVDFDIAPPRVVSATVNGSDDTTALSSSRTTMVNMMRDNLSISSPVTTVRIRRLDELRSNARKREEMCLLWKYFAG